MDDRPNSCLRRTFERGVVPAYPAGADYAASLPPETSP